MIEPRAVASKHQRYLLPFFLGCLLVIALAFWWLAERSPNISYLTSHPPAHWIVYPTTADGSGLPAVEMGSEFRRTFQLDRAPSTANLSVRAFKRGLITINGKPIAPGIEPGKNWKDASDFDIAPLLQAGTNEISVTVFNDYGPPALWLSLSADSFSLRSDQNWNVSYAGAAWHPARLAETPMQIAKGNALAGGETLCAALGRQWPGLFLFAAATGLLLLAGRWWLGRQSERSHLSPRFAPDRWPVLAVGALAVAWAALWANNAALLPPQTGFDISSHLDYINYILQRHRLPLPNEGFEMYQPPLYYLIAAGLLALFHLGPLDPNGIVILRIFGLLCGIATFTLAFLSARLVFPGQPRKQFFVLLLAALMPTNLYIYQYATNELLATTMAALSVYCCLRIIRNPELSPAEHAWFGLALGGALLTKSSAVVLPPVLFAALVWNLWARRPSIIVQSQRSRRREEAEIVENVSGMSASSPRRLPWISCLGAALFVCIATAGWHYVRIARHFGNPLLGNWDAAAGFQWWQQAGYRTSSYYTHLGRSLRAPLFSSFGGFGDGVYSTLWGDSLYGGFVEILFRPPWNYDYMAAGYLFALLPTLAILLGAAIWLHGFLRKPESRGLVVLGVAAMFALLLFYYSFKVPVYASNKAFYASAALVPVCLLGAAGWNLLCRWAGRFCLGLYVLLGVWAITTYATYWIRGDAPHTLGLVARTFSDSGHPDVAVARLKEALRQYPHDPELSVFLLFELLSQGKPVEAAALARETLPLAPANSDLHLALGSALAVRGNYDDAIREAKRAIELAPDDYAAEQRLAEWLNGAGRKTEALDACREALRIVPSSGKMHYLLGTLLGDLGDTTNALPQLYLATRLDPDLAVAQERLGVMLMNANRPAEATPHLADAVKLSPKDAGCWCRLAQSFALQDKIPPAVKFFRHALELDPKYIPALGDLAWQLATCPDPTIRNGAEAVQLATQACDLSSRTNAQYLETLSAAYAETGRFDEAIATVKEAVALADKDGNKDVADSGRNLEQHYQSHQPYRQAGAASQ